MMYVLNFFDPTASATAYGRRPKFAMAKQSATAEGENCAYSPTLPKSFDLKVDGISFLHNVQCCEEQSDLLSSCLMTASSTVGKGVTKK